MGDGDVKGNVKNDLGLHLRESKVTWKACVLMLSDLTRGEGQDEGDGLQQVVVPRTECWGREGCWPGEGTQLPLDH